MLIASNKDDFELPEVDLLDGACLFEAVSKMYVCDTNEILPPFRSQSGSKQKSSEVGFFKEINHE